MKPASLSILLVMLKTLKGRVTYGFGSKADEVPFFRDSLASLLKILHLDCSGLARLGLYRATSGSVKMPDGSQNQLAYFEKLAKDPKSGVRKVSYVNAARYMTDKRLFICFIKPYTNGCKAVGHVWFLLQRDGKAMTFESHGGKGVNSRDWDYGVLPHEVYACFELPATK